MIISFGFSSEAGILECCAYAGVDRVVMVADPFASEFAA